MSDSSNSIRGSGIRGAHVASALFAGFLALSATYAVPVTAPPQHGTSVHAKNSATPDWIRELHSQNARQLPVAIETEEPSFWI